MTKNLEKKKARRGTTTAYLSDASLKHKSAAPREERDTDPKCIESARALAETPRSLAVAKAIK